MRINDSISLPFGYGINKVTTPEKPRMDIYKDREKQNEEKKESLYKQKAFLEYFRECQIKVMPIEADNKIMRKKKDLL